MPLIRSISGLRGTLGDSLTPETVVRYISAFAEYSGYAPVVVGHDGRPSGAWIQQVVLGTLAACGVEARALGMAPTPTVQMATETTDAAGGISITASHNPIEWNGLKFLNADGVFLGPEECHAFFQIVDREERNYGNHEWIGNIVQADKLVQEHVQSVLALPFLDKEALKRRKFRIVVDAVHASGSFLVPELLETLGCEVIRLFCDGSGQFPHTPEPIPQNLTQLCEAVREHNADFGIAVDPDADRLVLIDENGNPIGEEYTITQAADFMLAWNRIHGNQEQQTVAVNLSTTRAVDDVAARHGAQVTRTAVGEINVVNAMKKSRAIIGGEGSGGVILPTLHYGRDSLAGIAITLANMLRHGGMLSELRADLPQYHIVKKKTSLPQDVSPGHILEKIGSDVSEKAQLNTVDGVRIDFERSWVHLRASNTEPIMRIIAEAPTEEEAQNLAEHYAGKIKGFTS